jgi:hypothetical protein
MEKFIENKENKTEPKTKYPWMKDVPLILLVVIFFGYFNFFTLKSYDILISLYYLVIFLVITRIVYPPLFNLVINLLKMIISPPNITLDSIKNLINK